MYATDYHSESSYGQHFRKQQNSFYNGHSQPMSFQLTNHSQNREQYYNLENAPKEPAFNCEVCNRNFFSHYQYKKHIDEHVECPFPECKLKANIKIIDQHINHQHMLVNFEALQIDDETWIAERKKRFPSIQRAELRRAQQLERVKRGERLGKDKRGFGNHKFMKGKEFKSGERTDFKQGNKNKCEVVEETENKNKSWRNAKRYSTEGQQFKRRVPYVYNVDPYDSDPEMKCGVPAFKGTKAFLESTGEISLFGLKNQEICGNENDINISDEEDWNNEATEKTTDKELHNALGILISAYDSDSDAGVDSEGKQSPTSCVTNKTETNGQHLLNNNTVEQAQTDNASVVSVASDCLSEKNMNSSHNESNRNKRKRKHQKAFKKKEPDDNNSLAKKRMNMHASKFRKPKYRRPTLLQRLLEPDIIHERNVILQCIKFIVNNNFFDEKITSNSSSEETSQSGNSSSDKKMSSFCSDLTESSNQNNSSVIKKTASSNLEETSSPCNNSSFEKIDSFNTDETSHQNNSFKDEKMASANTDGTSNLNNGLIDRKMALSAGETFLPNSSSEDETSHQNNSFKDEKMASANTDGTSNLNNGLIDRKLALSAGETFLPNRSSEDETSHQNNSFKDEKMASANTDGTSNLNNGLIDREMASSVGEAFLPNSSSEEKMVCSTKETIP